jgi:hypothetical protein
MIQDNVMLKSHVNRLANQANELLTENERLVQENRVLREENELMQLAQERSMKSRLHQRSQSRAANTTQ